VSMTGPNWLRPVGTRSGSRPIGTGLRTGKDRIGPVWSGPVCGLVIFRISRTGSVPGSSPEGSRTGTGPDFKALAVTNEDYNETRSVNRVLVNVN
jgi:hypothetical protein